MGPFFGNALLAATQAAPDQRRTIQPVPASMYGEGLPQGYVQWAMQNHPHLFQPMTAMAQQAPQAAPQDAGPSVYTDQRNFLGRFPTGYRPA